MFRCLLVSAFFLSVFAATAQIQVAADYTFYRFQFSTTDGVNNYLRNAPTQGTTAHGVGVRGDFTLQKLHLTIRVGHVSQSVAWDSINVSRSGITPVRSQLEFDYSRLRFEFGIGYRMDLGPVYLQPEVGILTGSDTGFEAREEVTSPMFFPQDPSLYELSANEFGVFLNVEAGLMLNDHWSVALRPGYQFSQFEVNISEQGEGPFGSVDMNQRGLSLGAVVGYRF